MIPTQCKWASLSDMPVMEVNGREASCTDFPGITLYFYQMLPHKTRNSAHFKYIFIWTVKEDVVLNYFFFALHA